MCSHTVCLGSKRWCRKSSIILSISDIEVGVSLERDELGGNRFEFRVVFDYCQADGPTAGRCTGLNMLFNFVSFSYCIFSRRDYQK